MITTENLWKKFGQVGALRGLNLSVQPGSATALIGSNGAGKSTLIRVLMNLLQPSFGRATVLGVDSRKIGPRELTQIGYVAESQRMPSQLTTGEYIAYLRPFYPQWDLALEAAIVKQIHLPLNRKIGDLSHGMRMKMGVACALPFRPKVLILDEPLSGLDPLVRDDLMESLAGQAGETTIFISSQELGEIESLATHVALLQEGELLFQESMEGLTSRFREVRVTLDHAAEPLRVANNDWLHVETSGNVVAFVETKFSEEAIGERVRAAVGESRRIDVQPMPLRSIFTTLAKAKRERTRV
jgi:ABC-2 type transport system ATP-binding protein